jgi:hypothetical protein
VNEPFDPPDEVARDDVKRRKSEHSGVMIDAQGNVFPVAPIDKADCRDLLHEIQRECAEVKTGNPLSWRLQVRIEEALLDLERWS